MRVLLVLLFLCLPLPTFANLAGAIDAYNADQFEKSSDLASSALQEELSAENALLAREILLISEYYLGQSGSAFIAELQALDYDITSYYGQLAVERLSILFHLSELHYQLGHVEEATEADVRIARIAYADGSSIDDLLWALRNIASTYHSGDDPQLAVYYTSLLEFFAVDFLGADAAFSQEAVAMSALALFKNGELARGGQKFFAYDIQSWEDFAATGPDEESLVADLFQTLDVLPIEDFDDWIAEIEAEVDAHSRREELFSEIGELVQLGNLDFASPYYLQALSKMDEYLLQTHQDDPVVAVFGNLILKSYLEKGSFGGARPYLAGLLSYPAPYSAILDIQTGRVAAVLAERGGVEDVLLVALVTKALAIEELIPDEDPELRFDLFFALAQIKERNGDYSGAFNAYSEAISYQDDFVNADFRHFRPALNGAGRMLASLGKPIEALGYQNRLLDQALVVGDLAAASAAYGALTQLSLDTGTKKKALEFAQKKLVLEESREPPNKLDLHLAQMNLAVAHLWQVDEISPEVVELMTIILDDQSDDQNLNNLQLELMVTIANHLGATPDTIRSHNVFSAATQAQKARLVTSLVEAEMARSSYREAKALIAYGYELAIPDSDVLHRLKQSEGKIAIADGRIKDALALFRSIRESEKRVDFQLPSAAERVAYHLSALQKLNVDGNADKLLLNEAFDVAQSVAATSAGLALNAALLRDATNDQASKLLRTREILHREVSGIEVALGQAAFDGKSAESLLTQRTVLQEELDEIRSQLSVLEPEISSIINPAALHLADVRKVMRDDEIIAMYVTSDAAMPSDESASYLFAFNKEMALLVDLPKRSEILTLSSTLRCSAALTDPGCSSADNGTTRGSFGALPTVAPTGPSFDTGVAFRTYETLIAPIETLMEGRSRLIVIPDAALMSLPFHLALQTPLSPGRTLADADWLIRDYSVEIVPSVMSFEALRRTHGQTQGSSAFLGIGDPLIGTQRLGAQPYNCETDSFSFASLAAVVPTSLKRSTGSERAQLVADLAALPDTRCELREIADRFTESRVLIHGDATESRLKEMSVSKQLRRFSVLNFATHGLIAGEIGVNDSGLVLSPPPVATASDDGLLTTAEISALDLNADFVILSACNTASGDSRNEEGLSGMASAFFVAGARSLLVSHWPVYSDAAVKLTTRSLDLIDRDPDLARAEAVRLAMLSILDDPDSSDREQHPAYWAPFMVVGDGLGLRKDQ